MRPPTKRRPSTASSHSTKCVRLQSAPGRQGIKNSCLNSVTATRLKAMVDNAVIRPTRERTNAIVRPVRTNECSQGIHSLDRGRPNVEESGNGDAPIIDWCGGQRWAAAPGGARLPEGTCSCVTRTLDTQSWRRLHSSTVAFLAPAQEVSPIVRKWLVLRSHDRVTRGLVGYTSMATPRARGTALMRLFRIVTLPYGGGSATYQLSNTTVQPSSNLSEASVGLSGCSTVKQGQHPVLLDGSYRQWHHPGAGSPAGYRC